MRTRVLWATALGISTLGLLFFARSMLAIAESRDHERTAKPDSEKQDQTPGQHSSEPVHADALQNDRNAYLELQQAIEKKVEGARVDSRDDLERILSELQAQARERGHVSALEVETGARLIIEYGAGIERQIGFERDMQHLQEELAAAASPSTASELPPSKPPALLSQIEQSQGTERAEKVEEYLNATAHLSPEEQIEATLALNQVTSPSLGPRDPAEIDSLYQGIENAEDQDTRAAFTRDYLAAIDELPIEEQLERSQALNQLTASQRTDGP